MTTPAQAMRELRKRVQDAAQKGVAEGMMALQTAGIKYTPKGETGYLRASSRITPILMTTTGISVALTYDAIYARYQHEGYGFNFTTPGTGAGYLQRAVDENEHVVKQIITNHIKGAL